MNVVLMDLPTTVRGFVRLKEDYPTIVLNSRLSYEAQRECYKHELWHLLNNDFEKYDINSVEAEAHRGRIDDETCWNLHEGFV